MLEFPIKLVSHTAANSFRGLFAENQLPHSRIRLVSAFDKSRDFLMTQTERRAILDKDINTSEEIQIKLNKERKKKLRTNLKGCAMMIQFREVWTMVKFALVAKRSFRDWVRYLIWFVPYFRDFQFNAIEPEPLDPRTRFLLYCR